MRIDYIYIDGLIEAEVQSYVLDDLDEDLWRFVIVSSCAAGASSPSLYDYDGVDRIFSSLDVAHADDD